MMAVPLIMGSISPVAGTLSDRYGPRGISLCGLLILAGGCLSISTLDAQTTAWGYVLRLVPFGLGLGVFQSPNNSAIMGAVPRERLGVASGLLALSRTLGHTSGLPLVGGDLFRPSHVRLRISGAHLTSAPPAAFGHGPGRHLPPGRRGHFVLSFSGSSGPVEGKKIGWVQSGTSRALTRIWSGITKSAKL